MEATALEPSRHQVTILLLLTVGATKSNGSTSPSAETKASYSSKGPTTYDHVVKPDIMAPGNDIVSLAAPGATLEASYPNELVTGTDGKNDYFTLSGTSMATPAVVGAVALLLQEQSTLTPDQVKARLMKTAYKMNGFGLVSTSAYVPHLVQTFVDFYDLFSVGSGLLNVQAATTNSDLAPANVGAALSRRQSLTRKHIQCRWRMGTRASPALQSFGALRWSGVPQLSGELRP